jgi:hypothetical protein
VEHQEGHEDLADEHEAAHVRNPWMSSEQHRRLHERLEREHDALHDEVNDEHRALHDDLDGQHRDYHDD